MKSKEVLHLFVFTSYNLFHKRRFCMCTYFIKKYKKIHLLSYTKQSFSCDSFIDFSTISCPCNEAMNHSDYYMAIFVENIKNFVYIGSLYIRWRVMESPTLFFNFLNSDKIILFVEAYKIKVLRKCVWECPLPGSQAHLED